MITTRPTKINGCFHIIPDIFYDFRGEYVESWNKVEYEKILPKGIEFVQDDFSISSKNTLRGFHGDSKTWKLVQAKIGRILLYLIDISENSTTYGNHDAFIISKENHHQVLIPAGVAVAHLCLSEQCMFDYKQSEYYDRDSQFTYNYKSDGAWWPVKDNEVILSNRDRNSPLWERK